MHLRAGHPLICAFCRSPAVLPSIVNAGIFTSAFSAGNSFLFCSSRILYGLALRGQAPKIFAKCTKNGLPLVAVLFCVGLFLRPCAHALLIRRRVSVVLCVPRIHERQLGIAERVQVSFDSSLSGNDLLIWVPPLL